MHERGIPMPINFSKAAAKWKSGMSTAGPSYTDGIDGVTTSPTELAAQNEQGYLQGVSEAVSSGRFSKGLRKVSLSDWKKAAKDKGAQRLASGAAAAAGKVEKFWISFGPKLQQITDQTRSMPKGTFEERQQRMLAQSAAAHALKGDAY